LLDEKLRLDYDINQNPLFYGKANP